MRPVTASLFAEFVAGVVGMLYSCCKHAGVVPFAHCESAARGRTGSWMARLVNPVVLMVSGKL